MRIYDIELYNCIPKSTTTQLIKHNKPHTTTPLNKHTFKYIRNKLAIIFIEINEQNVISLRMGSTHVYTRKELWYKRKNSCKYWFSFKNWQVICIYFVCKNSILSWNYVCNPQTYIYIYHCREKRGNTYDENILEPSSMRAIERRRQGWWPLANI